MSDLLIDDGWQVGKGAEFQSINPATNEILWQGHAASSQQITAAVASAAAAFPQWMMMPLQQRVQLIERYVQQLQQQRSMLAETISQEVGKPLWEALTEVDSMIAKMKFSLAAYHERTGIKEEQLTDYRAVVRHKPHGVLALLSPFNFPAHILNGHLIPALLAGNTLVIKPSDKAPLTAIRVLQCWQQAGLPAGVINLLQGRGEVAEALLAQQDIQGVLFTGSYATGVKINQQFAKRPDIILALEMGGNNPLLVMDASDIKAAAYKTLLSAYLTAGQRCTCARRLIVPQGKWGDQLIDELCDMVTQITVGSYQDKPEPFMGPVISQHMAQHLISMQEDKIKQGAKVLIPMEQLMPNTGLVTPGLLDVTDIESNKDDELFGPLLQLIRVTDFQQGIDVANNTAYGLSAGLFSEDPNLFQQFYQQVHAGLINWNRELTGASSALPFGGVGHSGNHRPSAYYAADYCAYPIACLETPNITFPKTLLPGRANALKPY